jgi:cytochrome b involved in lipid metabolism
MPASRRFNMLWFEPPVLAADDLQQQQQQQHHHHQQHQHQQHQQHDHQQLASSATLPHPTPSAIASTSVGDAGRAPSTSLPLPLPLPAPSLSIPIPSGEASATGSVEAPVALQARRSQKQQNDEYASELRQPQPQPQPQQQQQQQQVASEVAGGKKPPAAPAPIPPRGYERVDMLGRRRLFFSRKESALHNQCHDCWLIAHGKVYDVTAFMSRHPGGDRAILRRAGADATVDYDFHSSRAQKMWERFTIGYDEPAPGQSSGDCVLS